MAKRFVLRSQTARMGVRYGPSGRLRQAEWRRTAKLGVLHLVPDLPGAHSKIGRDCLVQSRPLSWCAAARWARSATKLLLYFFVIPKAGTVALALVSVERGLGELAAGTNLVVYTKG